MNSIYEHDMSTNGFPLMNSKRHFWRNIVRDLLCFLRGEIIDSREISIFGNRQENRDYSYLWRSFGNMYQDRSTGLRQLRGLLEELYFHPKYVAPYWWPWNPARLHRVSLLPCHFAYQFYTEDKKLHCMVSFRSSNALCGASYVFANAALLTSIIAWALHMDCGKIIVDAGPLQGAPQNTQVFPFLYIQKYPPDYDSTVDDILKVIKELTIDDFEFIE